MTVKKHIIHITTFLQGGAGRVICDLACDQLRRGFNVSCICNDVSYPGYSSYPEFEDCLSGNGVAIHKISHLFKRDLSGIAKAGELVFRYIQDEDLPYMVHCHASVPSLVAMTARDLGACSFPIVQTMHGWGTNKSHEQECMDVEILSNVDLVVPVSESAKGLLKNKGVPEGKMVTIYNGIPEPRVNIGLEEDFQLKRRLNENAFLILCLGTVCDRKNQVLLVEAVARLVALGIAVQCFFFGEDDSEYANVLKKKVELMGLSDSISFEGAVMHADRYLSLFDLLVLPTKSEGLPLSILEAFREKTLVAASNIPECRELVQDKKTGFLFDANSVESLTAVLAGVFNLEKRVEKGIIDLAFGQYENNFRNSVMLNKYSHLYSQLADQSSS